MIRFNKGQKIAMVALPLAILFNPLTVEIYFDYFKMAFFVISLVSTAYVVGFMLYHMLWVKRERVHIPAKPRKIPVTMV